jgi:hypothetical protein
MTVPTHQEGDLLVAFVTFGVANTISVASGWTALESQVTAGSYACRSIVAARYATDSEPANYTFTCISSAENVGIMMSIRYAALVALVDDSDFDSGTDATPDVEALTSEYDGGVTYTFFSAESNSITVDGGHPAGYTNVYTRASGGASQVSAGVAWKTADKGAVAATNFTLTGAQNWYTYNLVLRGCRTNEQLTTQYMWDLMNSTNASTGSEWTAGFEQQPTQLVVHTVPPMPSVWSGTPSDDLVQQVNVNVERLIQESDSTLTTRTYVSYIGGWANTAPVVHEDTSTAYANPTYQDAEVYDADHTDTRILRTFTHEPYYRASNGLRIRYYVTRVVAEFTGDDDGDDIEIFNAFLSTRFSKDDPTVPINTDVELCHRGTGNTKLYAPDYPVSAWHVRNLILKSINAMLTEMRPAMTSPFFGLYEFQNPE